MIDIHCHLTGEDYETVGGMEKVITRAKEYDVERMVCSGFDLRSSIEAKELAERFNEVYFCAGFHPSELGKYADGDLAKIRELCSHEKCVAVGEIGLDYHFEDNPPKDTQREFFIRQMQLASELSLPIVVHSRDAAGETLEILKKNQEFLKNGFLLHCYSYSLETAEEFLKLGAYFSFGGPCTFKNANKVVSSVRQIPATRILSETDCPYLAPVPFRGEFPNEPKNVKFVVEKISQIKEIPIEEMRKQIKTNAKNLFLKLR